jgi:steroid delta-isomerase-like uncharacterized protein
VATYNIGPARNRRLIERFYDDMWNRFDHTVIPGILAQDVTFRGSFGRHTRGHEEFARYMDLIQAAFPDFHNEIIETITDGPKTFAHLVYTGTHRGEIFGIPPTGKQIRYEGAAVFTIRQLITDVWVLGDVHTLLTQLRS